jgi:hypothetical protein
MPTSNNTPLFFEFWTSFDNALASSGVSDYVNSTITETVTDSDGVVWTQVFEYAVQSSAGTATDTETITNTNGFSAVIVLTADNYSGSVADLMGQDSVFDDGSSDLAATATGDFGNFTAVFPATGGIETWSGEFVTVDGGLLTSVNLQIHYDSQDMLVGNGSAVRDGQAITFDDFVFYDLYTLSLVATTIINGTANNDVLTIQTDTTSVQAGAGTDTVIFSGNYADYTFSQSDSFVPLITNNATTQVVSMSGVEQLQFDNITIGYAVTGSGEFQVNTYTQSSQNDPFITSLNNGGFVAAWESYGQDNPDGLPGVYAQMYDGNGALLGAEFQVNTYTDNFQWVPYIATLNNNGFVVAWNSDGQDGDSYGIYAQMYNADGTKQGGEFQVNTYTAGVQYDLSIAALANGGFVVTWTSSGQDGIYAQMYDSDGSTNGNEFNVASLLDSNSYIAALSDGGFVVAWNSDFQDGSERGIFAQMYNAIGSTNGAEFQINTYTTGAQYQVEITTLTDGGFVATWTSDNQDSDGSAGIYAQIYDTNGSTQGNEFQVNTYTTQSQKYPSISALDDGGFVIAWASYLGQDGDAEGIFAQRYDSEGNPLGVTTLSEITDSADALVSSTSGLLLNNLTLHHYKDGLDTGVSTLIEQGGIEVNTDVVFDYVVFETNNIYSDNLNILDLYGVLNNIGQAIDTNAEHASDMDNDGVINILDLYATLNGIGQAPQTFDLVDQDGNLVTGLNTDLADIANWTIVANGDVNMSGGFEDAYLVQTEIV